MDIEEGCLGGYHPICNECGISEIWEISPEEYNEAKFYWNNWLCPECINQKKMIKLYKIEK